VTGRATATSPLADDNPLAQYIDVLLPRERAEQIKADYASGKEVMDGHIKAEVGAAINTLLAPMRERRARLEEPPQPGKVGGEEMVLGVIREGIKKANAQAEETLALAKKAMQIDFGPRTLH
jgi:hypothetical protein